MPAHPCVGNRLLKNKDFQQTVSRLVKNSVFLQPVCGIGTCRHFRRPQVVENEASRKSHFRRSAVKKSMDALFLQPVRGSIRSPAGDKTAAAALYLFYPASYSETELGLQDSEIMKPQQTQQPAESLEKIGYALAHESRLPAPPGVASRTQYTGYGIAGIGGQDYVGAGGGKR